MDLVEALQTLARQRGRGEHPLVALRPIPARPGARISHLPVSQALAHAWVTVTGEPFHQHQSLALAALRRGEPLALVGGQAARQTIHLLTFELLRAEAPATVLFLAPDEPAAEAHGAGLARIATALGEPLRVGLAHGPDARAAIAAQAVVATSAALHERLLRYHDRAWAAFWSRLRLIVVADAHTYGGLAAAHLAALLLRAQRLAPGAAPQLAATIAPVAAADEALALIGGAAWRIIAADDTPAPAGAFALWRAPGERARESLALALGLARAGATVHLTCPAYEAPLLRALLGPDERAVTVGPSPLPAQAQIFVGLADATPHLRGALDGAALVALVIGDDPAERALARLAAHDPEQLPLLDGPPPCWVAAAGNAYVAAQHLVCAASERPLAEAEIDQWQAATILPRLEERGLLVALPGPEPAWQPSSRGEDPYQSFDLRGAGSAPALIRGDQGALLGAIDQATFDRWGFAGAALPPVRGGYRVIERNDPDLELTLRQSPEARRTLPLRRASVRVRDRREQRAVRGREVGWGRVVVDEEVYGYREASPGGAPAERALNPAITSSWSAPALWVDLAAPISVAGQLIGWSLAAALPLRAISTVSDLVPVYDAEARRLYFVDAQPGGSGLAVWLFGALEELLPLAYDVALDCRNDPLLEPLARADMDWLLALLGGALGAPPPERRPPGATPAGPRARDRQEQEPAQAERDRLAREARERQDLERAEQERARLAREARERAEREARDRQDHERAEQERARIAERDRLAREARDRQDLERAEQERARIAERDRLARERAEREARDRQDHERSAPPAPGQLGFRVRDERGGADEPARLTLGARARPEPERVARERAEREEQERLARAEQERLAAEAQARAEQERLAAEARAEQERAAQAERDRLAREARERQEHEREEQERARVAERDRLAREARERQEHERARRREQERAAQAERDRLAREASERAEREAREAREREEWAAQELAARQAWEEEQRRAREAKERLEREQLEREAKEREARARAEREAREAKERAERAAKLERERLEREAQERAEREAQERAIREARARAEKAERERLAREREAQEARERAEKAERERLAREQAAEAARARAEAAERERAEHERQIRERDEAERLRLERLARERERDEAERERRARLARERDEAEQARRAPPEPRPPARGRNADPPQRGAPPRGEPRPQPPRGQPQRPAQQPPLPLPPEQPQRPAPRADAPRRPAPPPPEPEVLPDAAAMVDRLRRMREQRERQGRPPSQPPPRPQAARAEPEEARFRAGDTITCTPYGRGQVAASRVEGDREILVVDFPAHGRLTIDAAVSAARLVDEQPAGDPDDLPL